MLTIPQSHTTMHPMTDERSIWATVEDPAPAQPHVGIGRRPPVDAARRHYVEHATRRVGGVASVAVPGENGAAQGQFRVARDV